MTKPHLRMATFDMYVLRICFQDIKIGARRPPGVSGSGPTRGCSGSGFAQRNPESGSGLLGVRPQPNPAGVGVGVWVGVWVLNLKILNNGNSAILLFYIAKAAS